jgi:hypothetical protein
VRPCLLTVSNLNSNAPDGCKRLEGPHRNILCAIQLCPSRRSSRTSEEPYLIRVTIDGDSDVIGENSQMNCTQHPKNARKL